MAPIRIRSRERRKVILLTADLNNARVHWSQLARQLADELGAVKGGFICSDSDPYLLASKSARWWGEMMEAIRVERTSRGGPKQTPREVIESAPNAADVRAALAYVEPDLKAAIGVPGWGLFPNAPCQPSQNEKRSQDALQPLGRDEASGRPEGRSMPEETSLGHRKRAPSPRLRDLLSHSDVARMLALTSAQFRGLRVAKQGPPCHMLGVGATVYLRHEVEAWLNQKLKDAEKAPSPVRGRDPV